MNPPEVAESGGGDKQYQPEEIHIPGSNASSFSGRGVLQGLLRHLLKSRRRRAQQKFFLFLLPYPEVLEKGYDRFDNKSCLKKGTVSIVISLNYLYLNRSKHVGDAFGGRRTLTRKQWEAVRRIEKFLRAWIDVSLVTPEVMGRTSGKIESLKTMLSELHEHAIALAKPGAGYLPSPQQVDKPGKPVPKRPSTGKFMTSASFCTFKQVDASRLSFPGKPEFDPTPYLDPISREIFNDPLTCRMPIEQCDQRPPKLRVHCSRSEKIKLYTLLDASDRLRIHSPDEVCPRFGSGLFAVPKDLQRDRLILDSRGANLLESPPQRWVKSLASAQSLCKILREDSEVLTCSGNDLKDFYYVFKATQSRSRRNVLVGELHPKELIGLKALKEEHLQMRSCYGSLSTLAMGDSQAVELAQSCHLGLALQHGIVNSDNLTTMYKPVPRCRTMVGLVIDDFIAMSKVPRDEFRKGASEGAKRAERMQEVYQEVKLIPNVNKGFRDELYSSFWGADMDGENGMVRGSLKRAVPLAGIILRLVRIGHCCGNLMQVLVGSIISLFLFRRRLLALLDSCFESYRDRNMEEIFPHSGRCKSDLLLIAILMPMAATNLRARPPEVVAAADASNWGEAGVFSKIPRAIGKELTRHCLRKSVWVRLLTPSQALLKNHGMLPEEEELPDENQCFRSNALWTWLAEGLNYQLLFSKAKSGNRHINIGEVRSVLRTEKILSCRNPGGRILCGADSQVALGALIKGRSSSPAINEELCRSLPWMLALDSYLDLMYYHTSSNRADDPIRGRAIERARRELPSWWKSLAAGDYQEFDVWLHEHGLDAESLSELPDFSELCGDTSLPGVLPGFLLEEHVNNSSDADESSEGKALTSIEAAVQVDEPLPSSSTPARLPRETASFGRGSPSVGCRPSTDCRPKCEVPQMPCKDEPPPEVTQRSAERNRLRSKRDSALRDGAVRKLPPLLSAEAREALRAFSASQVERSSGISWPPKRAGFLDLFSGERGVAKELAKKYCTWSLCFDLEHSPAEDLDDPQLRSLLFQLLRLGCFIGLGGGPVCSSFSMAVRPPVRSAEEPYGKHELGPKMQAKVATGISMALWFFKLLEAGLHEGLAVWIENPTASWMFRLPEWKSLVARWPELRAWIVDYCRFGTKWRKRTKFFSNTILGGLKTFCNGCAEHQLLKGRSKQYKMSWTRVAQAYPVGVARAVARALAMKSLLTEEDRSFDPAGCAKTGHQRIGEASNPGPRRPRGGLRSGVLADVPLVEPRTLEIQDKVWGFAGVLTLGFLGIARPGEPLAAERKDLVLPRDMLNEENCVAYLRILKPKTRMRGGGRTQHLSVHDKEYVALLDAVFGLLPGNERLLECSPAAFRRRWDAVLSALKIDKSSGLTPGGVRGGGCVHAFQTGVSLPTLLWRMRIKHLQTLENYLQEVVASTVVSELSEESRRCVAHAAFVLFCRSLRDTFCAPARLAVLDFYGHVLAEYSDAELKETIQVAKSSDAALLGNSESVGKMKYKETQIHGEICFAKHVERLVAHQRHRDSRADQSRLEAVAKKFNWKLSWVDKERERMQKEERAKLGAGAWEERLAALMEKGIPDAPGGCGRPVAPGTTKRGKAFDTCCRGCVMGFGHDMTCGNIDPALLGPGKCKHGCGRPVNPGRHPSGRSYDTCCRGCSSGHHDATCGEAEDVSEEAVKPGLCKMRCGRAVAKAKDGRRFDTCCRGCATGTGHSKTCCLKSVLCCHAHGFVHRDLNAKNFMITGDDRTVKLIDFGLATRFYGYLPQDQYIEIVGTSHYMAPEMMISGKYSPAVDMWSLGVLLYVCLTGLMLLPKDDDRKKHLLGKKAYVEKKLEKCTQLQKRDCSEQARNLLGMMLKYEPAERISASEALSHPFILKHCHEYLGGAVEAETQLDETIIEKLRRFAKAPRLKKVAQLFMAHLAEHEAELLAARHHFRTLDRNGGGEISREELQAGLAAAGIAAPSDLQEIFDGCCAHREGKLHFVEFLACMMPDSLIDERLCHEAFNLLEGKGRLAAEDLQAVCHFDWERCRRMVQQAKPVDDGTDYFEFDDFYMLLCSQKIDGSEQNLAERPSKVPRLDGGDGKITFTGIPATIPAFD
eukprot:s255_g26.t1